MDAKTFAAEIETTINNTWKMWSKEATIGANGALVISPDLPAQFFKAQANNLAATYIDRLLPYNSDDNMDPDNVKEMALANLAAVCDISVANVREDASGVSRLRDGCREMMLQLVMLADCRFKGSVDVIYITIEHLDRLTKQAAEVVS